MGQGAGLRPTVLVGPRASFLVGTCGRETNKTPFKLEQNQRHEILFSHEIIMFSLFWPSLLRKALVKKITNFLKKS